MPPRIFISRQTRTKTTLKFDIFFKLKTNEVQDVYRLFDEAFFLEPDRARKLSDSPLKRLFVGQILHVEMKN